MTIPINKICHDRLLKIRPLIDHLMGILNNVPLDERLSIDGKICLTKVRHDMKQCNIGWVSNYLLHRKYQDLHIILKFAAIKIMMGLALL